MSNLLSRMQASYVNREEKEFSLQQYLDLCSTDPMAYAGIHERLLKAIGEPELFDTSTDPRLGRIFYNRTIRRYPAFHDFFGMEEPIEKLVGFLRHAAQGLEERKQIPYLLGPVGGGKSSLAERLKLLAEKYPFYTLKFKDEVSPVFESPLELFGLNEAEELEKVYGIPQRLITGLLSPWAVKRLSSVNGDVTKFTVVKMWPNKLKQICISKVEPGDENNQDISSLVGKVDIRMLESFSQNDPDAYSYSGGLNRCGQGLLEFVEMFKAPIKMLHPLLTATQEQNYTGTENIGAMPFRGMTMAHSNEAEWQSFKNNKNNVAFIDRIYVIKVPYCLRVTEEQMIYAKMVNGSQLKAVPCAPHTLEMLARATVLSRMQTLTSGKMASKLDIYDGKNLKDIDPNAKPLHEYREMAGIDEGMSGISTRMAFKILSATFNHDPLEISADPVHLLYVMERMIKAEQFPKEIEERYLGYLKNELTEKYIEFIGKEIQQAYIESYSEYGQNLFDRYIDYAEHWIDEVDYKDPDTGQMLNREFLTKKLEEVERPSNISNPKDFRNDIVKFCLKAQTKNGGKNPDWRSYEKIREVLETKIFGQMEDLLPIISYGTKSDKGADKKHKEFVGRMVEKGYTERQTRRLVEWYVRVKSNS